ncbi:MAG TPA: xanthine dehydrogenase family protein molybdopterin-binding subunit [Verrucomicrobiales bacterium]|nr:xanthine dehydrogenase family protein molybdopterin-binding subunit [Verrucomicrobiales bacterium]
MAIYIGKETKRVDGIAKVTGKAKYAAEYQLPNMSYGFLVLGTVARGRIKAIDTKEAETVPGVVRIFTHLNTPKAKSTDPGDAMVPIQQETFRALQDDRIIFNHQPVALVVAESFEQARYASRLVKVTYDAGKPNTDPHAAKPVDPPKDDDPKEPPPKPRGDAAKALKEAPVKVEAEYVIPIDHHNPMEPHGAVAYWQGEKLTIFEKSQEVYNVRRHLAATFGLKEEDVNVISSFVGGAFGSALRPNYYVALTAMAAKALKRPVKLVYTRTQMFTGHGYRPYTIQKVSLGAERDGKLTALIHEAISNTSTVDDYTEGNNKQDRSIYACPNLDTPQKLLKLDMATPCPMRAPGAVSGMFALECAMDELAYALKMDPLELRLKNYAETDPETGKPFSSKALRECYQTAAEKFGWKNRKPEPRSMRDGRLLVGWGMSTGVWPALQQPAAVIITLNSDGTAEVASATADIGPGTYTVMTIIAAEYLGLPLERVTFTLGDTKFPRAPSQGGSWTTASVGSAVHGAAQAITAKLLELALKDAASPLKGLDAEKVELSGGKLQAKGDSSKSISVDSIFKLAGLDRIVQTHRSEPSPERKKYTTLAHGAQFAEVKVDPDIGMVKVTRVIEVTACGKIINPKASHSQEIGGVVWGVGMALTEGTEVDHRYGRIMNPNLQHYHVPVNADIHEVETIFAEEEDRIVNPLGIKGMGELGMVGIPAAIANAVYHATGKRIRELPIRPENLI